MEPLRGDGLGLSARVIYALGYTIKVACLVALLPFAVGLATILTVMGRKKREKIPPPHIYCPLCLGDGKQPVLAMLRIRLVRVGANKKDIDGSERMQVSYHLDCERPGCNWKEIYSFEEFGQLASRWKKWRREAVERGEWVGDDEQ